MERVNAILRHPLFVASLRRVNELEESKDIDREFCRHDIDHLLDVARLSYIFSLESGGDMDKALFYAAGLLHDIGRARQYEDGTPHEQESARLAEKILPECGFTQTESALILDAILSHRTAVGEKPGFAGYIYRADKLSRRCFECGAIDDCDWDIKNMQLEY
jgi:uncharacterized protein